jgi:NAD(P)H-hydrate epimerase
MEKAALAAFRRFCELYPATEFPSVGVLVGPGHNGGDALVMARECLLAGREVVVWSPFDNHKELTRGHLTWFQRLGGTVADDIAHLTSSSVLIDGLLGFGTERPTEGRVAMAVSWANLSKIPIVAVDLPSGITSDTGEIPGETIRAGDTLCLGVWKEALLQDHASEYCGRLSLIDLGIPTRFIEETLPVGERRTQTIEAEECLSVLPPARTRAGHKYSHGRLLVAAGSNLYPGAAVLTILAARTLGVGYLIAESCAAVEKTLLEVAPDTVFRQGFSEALRMGEERTPHAAIVGPGLAPDAGAIPNLLALSSLPLVLDAGALAFLAREIKGIALSEHHILTPHQAEFNALFPRCAAVVPKSEQTRRAARESGAIVVHKGPHTTIAHPDGTVRINLCSTPALARAGSGDVLAGMIGALLAQQVPPLLAAQAAVWLHSQTAIRAANETTPASVDPMHLIAAVAKTLRASIAPPRVSC